MSADDPLKKPEIRASEDNDPVKIVKKKPYAAPRLTIYGSIEKLTQSGTAGGADGGMPMVCL